ncbi:MAG: hypothetical protein SFZ03_04440 [Candidatus Melainabacteria bacterium]|nr:hypothetical protein [Candidatus Melainabacteria bacterium]
MTHPPLTEALTALQRFIEQGQTVLATKTQPSSRLRCEHTVLTPAYDVVDAELFTAWREQVIAWLENPEAAATVQPAVAASFVRVCRRATCADMLEGLRLLRALNQQWLADASAV